ncbi:MAG: hypothetical protein ACR2OI_03620 [Acidimicrobiia bacterium]
MAVTLPALKPTRAEADHSSMPIRCSLVALILLAAGCSGGTASPDPAVVPSTILLPPADAEADAEADAIFVAALTSTPVNQGPTWLARVVVTVADNDGEPVANALVTGEWDVGEGEPGSCTTDSAGECALESPPVRKRVADVELAITGIDHDALTHDAGLDASGPDQDPGTVTISKP